MDLMPEQCDGCERRIVMENGAIGACRVYIFPAKMWRLGNCPAATHWKRTASPEAKRVNPLKQSKRDARRRLT